jgi:radical SAM/Cys-rich protein
MKLQTLNRSGNELAAVAVQRRILDEYGTSTGTSFHNLSTATATFSNRNPVELACGSCPSDRDRVGLQARGISVLQVNIGKVCNQTCAHCHVDAGPDRRENMSRATAEAVMQFFLKHPIPTLDITGGAPEMNASFRWLVEQAADAKRQIIDRCNLTILLANGFTDLPQFLAKHRVTIIASLPCYLESNCDAQRGDGTFQKSLQAIQLLNQLGYGRPDSELELNLVYNPVGAHLPPDQAKLEQDYRQHLTERYQIYFSRLFTITNMPISRFLDDLLRNGKFETYMTMLVQAFNPATLGQLMCRETLSVDWEGYLYDCDFNQMLEIPASRKRQHIADADFLELANREVATGNHCFGCTAGAGSSCQGSIA